MKLFIVKYFLLAQEDYCENQYLLYLILRVQKLPGMKEEEEPEEEEEEELGHAETYAEYMPMKCKYHCCATLSLLVYSHGIIV